jgi:predicted TIM-barrel fold metal-dependent hydrolase
MNIIDSQMHVWQANTPEQPWPAGAVSLQGEPFSMEEALAVMDEAGVQRTILVPPSWVGIQNATALAAARKAPDRFAVMGRFDPTLSNGPSRLEDLRCAPGMLGLRMMLNTPEATAMIDDPALAWFWAQSEDTAIPLMCFLPLKAPALAPLAARHPKLRLIIDHSGRNPRGAKDAAAWEGLDAMLELARFPNIAVKVSSLPCFSSSPYPFPSLHAPIRAMRDAFGAERLLWGSDKTRLVWPYEDNIRLFTHALDFLTSTEREWIVGKSASHWCGWP